MRARITKRLVDGLKPAGTDYYVFDPDTIGFAVRVRVTGGMSYVVQYKAGSGRGAPARRVTLGGVGKMTPEQARTGGRQEGLGSGCYRRKRGKRPRLRTAHSFQVRRTARCYFPRCLPSRPTIVRSGSRLARRSTRWSQSGASRPAIFGIPGREIQPSTTMATRTPLGKGSTRRAPMERL